MPNPLFQNHEKLIDSLYGSPEKPFHYFRLSEILNQRLIDYLKTNCTDISLDTELMEYRKKSNYLETSKTESEALRRILTITYNQVPLEGSNQIIQEMHREIRRNICSYLKSPFAFVNTRSWITKANSESFGPNKLHKDGFQDGHLKVMVYPNGLNGDNGGLILEGFGLINNMPEGGCICFQNSGISHSGVPGKKNDRLCIEITLQRTLVSSRQLNESHCDGRHLLSPWLIYNLIEENRADCETKAMNSSNMSNKRKIRSHCISNFQKDGITIF